MVINIHQNWVAIYNVKSQKCYVVTIYHFSCGKQSMTFSLGLVHNLLSLSLSLSRVFELMYT